MIPTFLHQDGPSQVSSHWEPRVLQGSIMAPELQDPTTVRIDPVTLAALQDSGWYTVDLSQAQSLVWGEGRRPAAEDFDGKPPKTNIKQTKQLSFNWENLMKNNTFNSKCMFLCVW